MKKYSQIQEGISVLMIFILLIPFSGCYSHKFISRTELPLTDSINYTYKVHNKKSNYLLENVTILNDTLRGSIVSGKSSRSKYYKIIVYPSSDSVLKINNEEIIKLSLDNIKKVEIKQFSGLKTFVLILIVIPIGILSYATIDFAINGFGMDLSIMGGK